MVTIFALCLLSIHFVYGAPSLVCVKHCLLQLFFSPSRYLLSLSIPSATIPFFKHLFCLEASNSSGHSLSGYYQFPALPPTFPSMLSIPYRTTTAGKPPTYISPSGLIPMQNLTGNNHLRLQSEVCRPNNKQRKAPALATRPVNIGEDIRKMVQRIRTWSHCMDCGGIVVALRNLVSLE
jgi:hypothetical protein